MGIPKLWGKDKDGNRGFLFSHVKTIYYNWASKILLSTKLDEMDALIDAKIAKAMMSNQQVNSTDKVPTSALAYAMSQNIAKNTTDITALNGSLGRWKFGGDAKAFAATSGSEGLEYLRIYTDESLNNYHQLVAKKSGLSFETYADGTRTSNWDAATKSDLASMYQGFSVKRSDNMSDYDSGYDPGGFRILFGVVKDPSSVAIVSFDILWIRLQFMVSVDFIKIRRGYGASGFTEWKTILP